MSFLRKLQNPRILRSFRTMAAAQTPRIDRISPLSADEAKWTELRKIEVSLQTRTRMLWTTRLTRVDSGRIKCAIRSEASAPVLTY